MSSDAQRRFVRVPRAGELSSLYVRAMTAGAGSFTTLYTVEVNSVNTTLVVTVDQDADPHVGSDTANVVTVAAGDRVSMEMTWPGGVPTADPLNVIACFMYTS